MKKIFKKTFITFLILVFVYSPFGYCDDINDDESIDVNAEIETLKKPTNEITVPKTNSRSCVVIDRISNTILYGKDEHAQKKMASTTKIMTALVIVENCNLNETITISKKAASTGGSRLGLKAGDKITILDLLYGLMLRSGNDAAVALAEYYGKDVPGFAEKMNIKAKELNLKNTHFETPHGLDSDGHYTTAYELAILTNYALKNPIFAKIVGTKNYTITINGYPKALSNTNELLGNFDGIYGVKTGFTNGANRCLVTACKRNDLDIICVVLGADTKKFRTTDSIKLINYIFQNFELVNIQKCIDDEFKQWKNIHEKHFFINKGISSNLDIQMEKLDYPVIPIRKDLKNSIETSINCKTIFEAPVYNNTEIGNIKISILDNEIANKKIYINNSIERKSPSFYFINLIKSFPNIFCNFIK